MPKILLSLIIAVFICVSASGAPIPAAVVNAASSVTPGLPNGDIAEGSIFVIFGTGMGPNGLQQVTSYPLPTSQGLAGTTVRATIGSVDRDCIMIYTSANQVAAILPSNVPVGSGLLTVSYQGAFGTVPIRVVSRSVGIFAVNQQGSGPGVITDGISFKLRTPTEAAHPGDILTIWATGLGPITADETNAPPAGDLNSGVEVFVAGKSARVLYGGRGSSAGLDQINFAVPEGLSGCYVSLVVRVNGISSNFITFPVTPTGTNVCNDPVGLNAAEIQKIQSSGTLKVAGIGLTSLTLGGVIGTQGVGARFQQFDAANILASHGLTGAPSIGSCTVVNIRGQATFDDVIPISGLDAGSQLTLTGPNGASVLTFDSKGSYTFRLSGVGSSVPRIIPGNYTITNGSGGADVGPFTAHLTVPPPLTTNNLQSISSVSRSQDLLVTWTGGGPTDLVYVAGIAQTPAANITTQFVCTERASTGQLTVPSTVLALIPSNGSIFGLSGMLLGVGISPLPSTNRFTAPGIDAGYFLSLPVAGNLVPIRQ